MFSSVRHATIYRSVPDGDLLNAEHSVGINRRQSLRVVGAGLPSSHSRHSMLERAHMPDRNQVYLASVLRSCRVFVCVFDDLARL